MQSLFQQVADAICTTVDGVDRTSLFFSAESSDFLRFNHAAVREATHVLQHYATLSVVRGKRQASATLSLTGRADADTERLLAQRAQLAGQLDAIADDPYLLLPDAATSTERNAQGRLPTAAALADAVARDAAGLDLVGFYAGGTVARGFADSRGQRNWHSVQSFLFDWSLYLSADKAVKTRYAGTHWSAEAFATRMQQAREELALLQQPYRTLAPGAYRVYLSPVAVADLLSTLSWGGFGLKDVRTGASSLIRMHGEGARMAAGVTLTEATADGIAPRFQDDGFVKPESVALVTQGAVAGTLNAPRSAVEYGVASNGCGAGESPESLHMAPGALAEADVLQTLGTGVYITHLHYLNYSDRQSCRMTGMTRFACFWVENGRRVAPISVMRFDDSLLRMFGEGLVALTHQAELMPAEDTYGARQLRSVTAPGAIVDGFRFTL